MLEVKNIKSYSLFNHPKKSIAKNNNQVKMEHPIPPEFKWGHKRVSENEIINIIDSAYKNEDEYKWVNKICIDSETFKDYSAAFVNNGLTPTEAQSILDQSIHHSLRAANWAEENEKKSGQASMWMLCSLISGIGKILLNNFESLPDSFKSVLSFFQNSASALRGYFQFKLYGERPDEDRAENLYEAKEYGNHASAFFADEAYRFETKINPWILPILSFFSENIQKAIKSLLSLPNILWWRIRMPQEINQRFATNVLEYIFHKPLSLFGFKKSIEKVENIQNEGNLDKEYIKLRAKALIGLENSLNKSISGKLFEELKAVFKGKFNKKHDEDDKQYIKRCDKKIASSIKVNKLIAPFLGLYGFFAIAVFTPIKSILDLFNIKNRFIDTINQTSCATQQIIYLFRLLLPEHLENIKHSKDKTNDEVNKLSQKRKNLFYMGTATCFMNIASVFLKLFGLEKIENKVFKTEIEVYNEVADKAIPYYLSKRRELLGTKFKLDNSELFNRDLSRAL